MQSLTQEQKAVIAKMVGPYKFPFIAAEAGCDIAQVRQFAEVVLAARAEQRQKEWEEELRKGAEKRAKAQAEAIRVWNNFLKVTAKPLYHAGKMVELHSAWLEECGEDATEEFHDSVENERLREDVSYDLINAYKSSDEFQDEIEERFREQTEDQKLSCWTASASQARWKLSAL